MGGFVRDCAAYDAAGRPATAPPLNWKSAVTMLVFLGINICVVHPFAIRIPRRKTPISLDFGNAPVVGVLVLWATTCIGWNEIVAGIAGNDQMHPYSIFILFFALAYICVSLDMSGVFRYVALHVARLSGTSGTRLFFYFYLLTCCFTILASNDIVILTLTPIILYFCKSRNMDPVPFLMAEYVTTNCWALLLYIGNATNIIVAEAYRLSFFEYTAWMGIPALVGGVTGLAMTWLLFRNSIPAYVPITSVSEGGFSLQPKDIRKELKDVGSAIFGSICLMGCLITLVVTSFFAVPVWLVTLPFAIAMLLKDIYLDVRLAQRRRRKKEQFLELNGNDHPLKMHAEPKPEKEAEPRDGADIEITDTTAPQPSKPSWGARNCPNLTSVSVLMPWKVGPFFLCMFVLIEAMNVTGWLAVFATWFQVMIAGKGVWAAVFCVGFLSSIGCVLFNNQPMTILFTKILLQPIFMCNVTEDELRGSMFSLVMGSNFGANLALNGALAGNLTSWFLPIGTALLSVGLMWIQILHNSGVTEITYLRFMKWGTIITIPVITLSCVALSLRLVL